MSTREIAIYDETFDAQTDLSGDQYKAVGFTSTGTINIAGQSIGILQNKPEALGAAAQVRLHGISRHVVDGSGTPIVIGSLLRGASGIGVVATAGQLAYGTALQPSTTSGDIIAVLMRGPIRIHS